MLKVKYLESGNNLKAGNTKRKRYFWLAIAFMVVLLLSISYSPVFAEETDDTGWVTENSNTYYTVNGKRVKGWRKIDKNTTILMPIIFCRKTKLWAQSKRDITMWIEVVSVLQHRRLGMRFHL